MISINVSVVMFDVKTKIKAVIGFVARELLCYGGTVYTVDIWAGYSGLG